MNRVFAGLLVVLLPACATLSGIGEERGLDQLWREAHTAYAAGRFAESEQSFRRVAAEYPESRQGVESLFYVGALRMDPRNPQWSPDTAAVVMRRYLARDSATGPETLPRPEALVILELASQLNLPAEDRAIPELQPRTRVITRAGVPAPPVRPRITPTDVSEAEAGALRREIDQLKRQVGDRDQQIRNLRDELERIRKTLTPQRP